jgi:hypothetical protein
MIEQLRANHPEASDEKPGRVPAECGLPLNHRRSLSLILPGSVL